MFSNDMRQIGQQISPFLVSSSPREGKERRCRKARSLGEVCHSMLLAVFAGKSTHFSKSLCSAIVAGIGILTEMTVR